MIPKYSNIPQSELDYENEKTRKIEIQKRYHQFIKKRGYWSWYRRELWSQGGYKQAERGSMRHRLYLNWLNDGNALIRLLDWVIVFVVVQVSQTFIQIKKNPKWAVRPLKVYTCVLNKHISFIAYRLSEQM